MSRHETSGGAPHAPVACTVVTADRLPEARVLARSYGDCHGGEKLYVLVVDDPAAELDDAGEPFALVPLADLPLGPRELHEMAIHYEAAGLARALLPSLLHLLWLRHSPRPLLYLGARSLVLSSLGEAGALATAHDLVLVPRVIVPLPEDARRPSEQDVLEAGTFNPGFVALGGGAEPFLTWWQSRSRLDAGDGAPGGGAPRWIDLAPGYFEPHVLRHPGYGVGYWNLDSRRIARDGGRYEVDGRPLVLFDFSGFDPGRPWELSSTPDGRGRLLLSERPDVAPLCQEYAERLAAEGYLEWRARRYGWSELPDGETITPAIRSSVRRALRARRTDELVERPPDPFAPGELGAFYEWLASPEERHEVARATPRLCYELYLARKDLVSAYPHLGSIDSLRFRQWVLHFGLGEEEVPEPVRKAAFEDGLWPAEPELTWSEASGLHPGYLVSGYLTAELGLGEAARRGLEAMRSAGIPCAGYPFAHTLSRKGHVELALPTTHSSLDVNAVFVAPDQLRAFVVHVGPSFFAGRYTVGTWAWETEDATEAMVTASSFVDEIWTLSDFTRASVSKATDKPVLTFTLPIVEPAVDRSRDPRSLGMPDGFVFLFVFDYLSTAERKNPRGLVAAFCRAFAPGEGPTLLLKSINGDRATSEVERLRHGAGERPDIVLLDGYLDPAECSAMLARADCYVSLHRAEGFGLTMAEAMALGRPVIASGYSGNLEFMNEENSYLVPVTPIQLEADAPPYRKGETWGDPDLEAAAELMRRVYESPGEAAAKAALGRRYVLTEHGNARAVRFLASRFEAIHERLAGGYESRVAERVVEELNR